MDLEQMLTRIGMESIERTPTLKTLNNLCMAFVSSLPFDTLDMFGGKRKLWDLPTIYQNIVVKKRGGFCCELNGMLQWVLKEFGFKVELLNAYAYMGEKFLEVSDHMTLLVTVESGEKWLTDVGWGGSCFSLPLRMELGVEQQQANGIYRLGKMGDWFTVEKKKQIYMKTDDDVIKFKNENEKSIVTTSDGSFEEKWNMIYGFENVPRELKDFQKGHDYAQDENEVLLSKAIAVIQNEKGRKFFVNNLYYEKEYVSPDVIKLVKFKNCTVDEMYPILEKEFGLKLDFELKIKCVE